MPYREIELDRERGSLARESRPRRVDCLFIYSQDRFLHAKEEPEQRTGRYVQDAATVAAVAVGPTWLLVG
jgi:hypothetical protein